MKAILITAALGLILGSVQQYRIVDLNNTILELQAAVDAQNDATDNLATAGQLDSSQSAERVAQILLDAERQAKALPKGAGPAVMNEFMRAVFQ